MGQKSYGIGMLNKRPEIGKNISEVSMEKCKQNIQGTTNPSQAMCLYKKIFWHIIKHENTKR